MKTKLSILLFMSFFAMGLHAEEVTVTWTADKQGYSTGQSVDGTTSVIDSKTSITFKKNDGANPPKYYSSGNSVRLYPANTMTIIGEDITKIVLTFGSGDNSNTITTNQKSYNEGVWSGLSEEVTFTIGGTSGHRKIASVSITYMSNEGGGDEPPGGVEKTDTVAGINALKRLKSGTKTCLYLSPESNARVVYANGGEVYLRDNGGAVCLNIDYSLFNPKPAHNQHVAGWIAGKYSDEDGLPQLLATENTDTKRLLFADPVTEPLTEPEIIDPEEFGAYYADWVLLEGIRISDSNDAEATGEADGFEFTLANRFGLTKDLYIIPNAGSLVNVSGIAFPNGSSDIIAPVSQAGIPAIKVIEVGNSIEELNILDERSDIYNLMGQRVTHPTPGIYIINGKKVFIK